jgi:triacylglycerol lipase
MSRPRACVAHGFGNRGRQLRKIVAVLEAEGIECVAPDLKPASAGKGIEPLAEQFAQAVNRAEGGSTVLIGFSMGSIVCRYYLQHLSEGRRFPLFLSISGPHAGSLLSHFVPGQGARQMRRGSEFLSNLAPVSELPVERVLSFWTPYDQVILPPRSSELVGAENHRFNVLGHRFMVSNQRVTRAVVDELRFALGV